MPGKDWNKSKSYLLILFLFNSAELLGMATVRKMIPLLPNINHQYGYWSNHSITTSLENLKAEIAVCFNENWPTGNSVTVVLRAPNWQTAEHFAGNILE